MLVSINVAVGYILITRSVAKLQFIGQSLTSDIVVVMYEAFFENIINFG